MVAEGGGGHPAGDVVLVLQCGQDVDDEGQRPAPRVSVRLVPSPHRGGAVVPHPGAAAHAVVHVRHEIRCRARGGEPQDPVAAVPGRGAAVPDESRAPVPVQVGGHDPAARRRSDGHGRRGREPVAAPVQPDRGPLVAEVDDVRAAVAVDVDEVQLLLPVARGQHGRTGQGDLRAVAAVAECRPVRRLAAAQQHDVLQAVAGQIRQPYPALAEADIGEGVEVAHPWDDRRFPPALALLVPKGDEGVRAGPQQVGDSVAVEVGEPGRGVGQP